MSRGPSPLVTPPLFEPRQNRTAASYDREHEDRLRRRRPECHHGRRGGGTAIAANKVPGVRAALAWDVWIAEGARKWNDANVLALSLKRLAPDVAVEITKAFLSGIEPDPEESANIARLGKLEEPHR